MQAIADSLLDALPNPHEIDVVRDLAVPLPVIVIAEVLGVPASDREQFKDWSTDIANTLGAAFQPPEVLERAQRSSNAIARLLPRPDRAAPCGATGRHAQPARRRGRERRPAEAGTSW